MSDAERRAYARGFRAKSVKDWPAHKPPMPPPSMVRDIMQAANDLRDEADCLCATFTPDDEVVLRLGPKIDAVDWAMKAVSEWLQSES